MEECTIISLNLGLHYDSHNYMRINHYDGKPKLIYDFRAAITYLVDWAASDENRTAIWRLVPHANVALFIPLLLLFSVLLLNST